MATIESFETIWLSGASRLIVLLTMTYWPQVNVRFLLSNPKELLRLTFRELEGSNIAKQEWRILEEAVAE